MFRHKGQERLLNQQCGSIPYMAPEVLAGVKHRAESIDMLVIFSFMKREENFISIFIFY